MQCLMPVDRKGTIKSNALFGKSKLFLALLNEVHVPISSETIFATDLNKDLKLKCVTVVLLLLKQAKVNPILISSTK